MAPRSETNEVWRAYKDGNRRKLNEQESYRLSRLSWLLNRGDVILLRRLGEYGYRLIHYEWPQSQYVDFWPRTGALRTHDGLSAKGWIRLLKILGVPTQDWRDHKKA